MPHAYDCSTLNRTRIPFKDLQAVFNDQLHVMSDLFTGIYLSLRTLLYGKTMLWYRIVICFARSGWVTIMYSKDTSVILYLASGFAGDPDDMMTQS